MTSNPRLYARFDLLVLAALVGLAACDGGGVPIGPSVDSNSNWLIQCHSHADCAADEGVCMTGICLQPQLFAADYDSQRCVDLCADSVNAHLLEPCLASGEPSDVCSAHADELVAMCRTDCARLHSSNDAPVLMAMLPDPSDPLPVGDDEEDSECWRNCVDFAFPELVSCRDAGGASDEECMSAFYDTVNACGAICSIDEGTGDPEVVPTGIYRAFWCGVQSLIESEGASRDEALANCQLNAQYNPTIDLYCTWNDEVIFDGCSDEAEVVAVPESCEGWEAATFDRAEEFISTALWSADEMNCDGASYRRFDARYGLWVGLVSCGSGYRFFLSETADGTYLPAADGGGAGEDFCELVDPSFSLPNEDDITSGGCTDCTKSRNYSFIAGEVFGRTTFGEPFRRAEAPASGNYLSAVIQCATGPVECGLPASPVDCELDPLGCR